MKKEKLTIDPQYVIDQSGKKTGVFLQMKTFENMLEIIEDQYFGQEAIKALSANHEVLDFFEVNKKSLSKKRAQLKKSKKIVKK